MNQTERIESLEKRLSELESRLELYQMFSAFGPVVDGGAESEVADFFTDDAEYRTDVPGFEPAIGRDALLSIFQSATHRGAIANGVAHTLGFPHVIIDGNKAQVINHSVIFIKMDAGWRPARVASNKFCCEKRDGHWQIVSRDNNQLGSDTGRALFDDVPYDLPWNKCNLRNTNDN